MAAEEMCHCGRPLHYAVAATRDLVEKMVRELGPDIKVTRGGRSWMVQRHYIALHGIKAEELPNLGFPEVH